MIVRIWHGKAVGEQAHAYERHVSARVFPALGAIGGNKGAFLLRRDTDDGAEFVVLTIWDSMEAVREFAGDDPEVAVVEPNARAVLSSFDEFVRHYQLVHGTSRHESS
jgi:heme-degrading monooxygenase HmoA